MPETASSNSGLSAALRPQLLFPWFAPAGAIKGAGPSAAKALARLLRPVRPVEDIEKYRPTVRDLLFHMPGGVIDRRNIASISALQKGQYATVEVTVSEHEAPPRHRPRTPYRVAVHDATGQIILNFFHVKGDYLLKQLPVGARRIICGTIDMYDGVPTMAHPDIIAPVESAAQVLKLAPSYPLTLGMSPRILSKLIGEALSRVTKLPEWHGEALLQQRSWPPFMEALKKIHQPNEAVDIEPAGPARTRLAYDELLANQLALSLSRRMEQRQPSYPLSFHFEVQKRLLEQLPFTFTAGQGEVLKQITDDMQSGARMVRLLQGDVGSGKTILAFAAMAQVAANGLQACLMAPTDLLARQHVQTLQPWADALRIPIALMSGKMKRSERDDVEKAVASGDIPLVIGTHALFSEDVAFKELALVIVDEQHRFGVAQRMKLTGKGRAPHLLQMTATPIPRSLCMTLYGDMEISSLTERPPGRQEIDTRAVPSSRIAEVIDGLKRVMAAGERAYWVCPLIERSDEEKADLAAAVARYDELKKILGDKVGLVHGRMKLAEREKVMKAFMEGQVQLLVATTVVEVGVNVVEATVMVIEHAERFGLAQLHQLRGRVGRSDKASRCVLLYHDRLSEAAKARLMILRETNDGFRIAEEDLKLRGAGDVLGTRQTGLPDFVLADMSAHVPLIKLAHDDARHVLQQDIDLVSDRGRALRLLLALFEYDTAMATLKSV